MSFCLQGLDERPSGLGETLLARAVPWILPLMTFEESRVNIRPHCLVRAFSPGAEARRSDWIERSSPLPPQ